MWKSILQWLGFTVTNFDPWETADEYFERMGKDPEWVRKREERKASLLERQAMFEREERPIVEDLSSAGVSGVKSVYDFVNAHDTPVAAIPVLLNHISLPYHPRIREGIARALSDKKAQGIATEPLIAQLEAQNGDDEYSREAIANALTVVATRGDAYKIKALLDRETQESVKIVLQTALKKANRKGNGDTHLFPPTRYPRPHSASAAPAADRPASGPSSPPGP